VEHRQPTHASDACLHHLVGTYTVTLQGNQAMHSVTVGSAGGGQTLWVQGSDSASNATLTACERNHQCRTLRLESVNQGYQSNLAITGGMLRTRHDH